MIVEYSLISDVGKVRETNEDNYCFFGKTKEMNLMNNLVTASEKASLVAVCDGMGGMSHGEIASEYVASVIVECVGKKFPIDECDLAEFALQANMYLCEEMRMAGTKFGSTLSMLLISNGMYYICNIGDSPIFLLRNGQLRQITKNHTEAANFERIIMTANRNTRKELTQYIGILPDEMILEPYLTKDKIESGDKFILCTDGLTDMVSEDEIKSIVSRTNDSHEISRQLVNSALENGGIDNITVISAVVQTK